MSSPKNRAQTSSSFVPLAYITGAGVDKHAVEVQSRLYPFAQDVLDENVIHLLENTLVLCPHWFGHVPAEMAELFKDDVKDPLCFQSSSALASHIWVSKNLSRSFPSSEVRNSPVKWADWIDKLLPRYGAHWNRAGIHDAILLSKQSINRDENLLAAALCFWNPAGHGSDFLGSDLMEDLWMQLVTIIGGKIKKNWQIPLLSPQPSSTRTAPSPIFEEILCRER